MNTGGIETSVDADKQSGASLDELLLEAFGACIEGQVRFVKSLFNVAT